MTTQPTVGRLERVDLREVWRHEARSFTRWLEDNMDVLGDVLRTTLHVITREHPTGSFYVDIVCEDAAGRTVVVENQLEASNHDHLGKLLTYLAAVEAEGAAWIVKEPRAEHVKAVAWLNECGAADFWLVKLEAVRIGDSPPAPILTLIVGPSAEQRDAGETKKEIASRYGERREFWSAVLDLARPRLPRFRNISPSQDSWISASTGWSGLNLTFNARQHDASVQLNIETPDADANAAIFEALLQQRGQIEEALGGAANWNKVEGRKACRLIVPVTRGGYRDDAHRDAVIDEMVCAMERLEAAVEPLLPAAVERGRSARGIRTAVSGDSDE